MYILTANKFVGTRVKVCRGFQCSLCGGSATSWDGWVTFNCGGMTGDMLHIYNPNFYTIFCEVEINGLSELMNIGWRLRKVLHTSIDCKSDTQLKQSSRFKKLKSENFEKKSIDSHSSTALFE